MTTSSGLTRQKTCTQCGKPKLIQGFRKFARGYRAVCIECESGATPAAEPAPEPVKLDGLHLELARGYGFRASAENGQLVIEHDADDGATATVVFSKTEAKVLFAQFAEWAAS
jgi:hypothetical protein